MLHVGSRLGPYEILASLHAGTTETYRAYDHREAREVTLQVFRVELGTEPEPTGPSGRHLEIYNAGGAARAAYVVSVSPDAAAGAPIDARLVPLSRRVATAAAVVAGLAALVVAATLVRSINTPERPVTPPTAAASTPRAAPAAAEGSIPGGEVQAPTSPVDAPAAGTQSESSVAPGGEQPAVAETRPVPSALSAPPSPKPSPAAVEPVSRPPRAATSARPLTPVIADGRDAASLVTEASVRATEFDLAGAIELLNAAAGRGDVNAQVAALYIRGLLDAREAFREGGPAETLAPIREAIASLEQVAKERPGSAEIARLMLHAAAAAAQSERDEMSLYLETALEMESLQRLAGLPGAPLVAAAEVAGDLWLQVHRYEDARRAYTEAAERGGFTLRILSGLARAARRLNDVPAACASYRRLLDAWGGRPGLPVEVAEARAYVGGCAA